MRTTALTVMVVALAGIALAETETKPLFENSDFETGTLKNWKASGTAFAVQPTKGDNPKARGRGDHAKPQGSYWIGTYEAYDGKKGSPGKTQGDGLTGTLTSSEFTIASGFINFMVGAGAHKETSVRLLVAGKNYYLASGKSSETMYMASADVKAFKGKKAQIVLVDNETGGWGHINADNFTASDTAVGEVVKPIEASKVKLKKPGKRGGPVAGPAQSAEMKVEKTYLLMPICNKAAKPQVSLVVDGKEVRFVTAPLASSEDEIDWWAFFNISEYKGKTLELNVSGLSDEGFKLIRQDDRVPGEDEWGNEPKRPQFHFSQKVGWNNDPNGMVYYDGEWHLFLQHNPVALPWGNMTWAHAVSKDLVHWKQFPNALHHRRGDAMFSGGGAVDWKNTGGWKTGDNDVIVITWTSTGRGECIAYSNDKGRTFTEYEANPVIKHRGRDPKTVWYAYGENDKPLNDTAKKLGGHWVIAVYDETKEHGRNIAFYSSTDLKQWQLESNLPGYYECAELFTLPVDGDENHVHWVVFAADAKYAIGDFDGRTFTPEHEGKHQLHWGPYYASQLFSDAPDDRRIQIGWARIGMGDSPFNQTFTFPTELTLRTTPDGVRMCGEPVKEIETAHGKAHKASNKTLTDGAAVELKTKGALFDIRATWEVGTAKVVGLDVDGREEFSYDVATGKAKGRACKIADGGISVQILIDRPMKETFVDGGRMVFTEPYNNDLNIESVKAWARGGEAKLVSMEVHELDASWK